MNRTPDRGGHTTAPHNMPPHNLPLDTTDTANAATPVNTKKSTGKNTLEKAVHWSLDLETTMPPASDMPSSLAKVSSPDSHVSRPLDAVYQTGDQRPSLSKSQLLSTTDATPDSLVTTDTLDRTLGGFGIREKSKRKAEDYNMAVKGSKLRSVRRDTQYGLSSLPLCRSLELRDVPLSPQKPDRSAPISQTAADVNTKPSYFDCLPDELLLDVLKSLTRRGGLTVLSSWFLKGVGRFWEPGPGCWQATSETIFGPRLVPVHG
jgi:hypothetical protein